MLLLIHSNDYSFYLPKKGGRTMKKTAKKKSTSKYTKSTTLSTLQIDDMSGHDHGNTTTLVDNSKEGKIKAAAYIRVSTDEQAESGYSLELQRERITAQITAKGWQLVEIYEDAGQSGGKLDRPALKKMLSEIGNGNINAVVVYKLDRLSRKQRDTMYLIEDVFLKQNIELVSISESLDTSSPTGRAMIGMLSVFAQLERDTITERLSDGRKQKAKTGGYAGGNVAIGYTSERGKKVLDIDSQKAAAIKRAFELKESGLTLQKIADSLNAEGHTTKQNALFTPTQVMRILKRREFYQGLYGYSDIITKGQHAAII